VSRGNVTLTRASVTVHGTVRNGTLTLQLPPTVQPRPVAGRAHPRRPGLAVRPRRPPNPAHRRSARLARRSPL